MEFAAGGDMFEFVIKNKGSGPGEGLPEDVARHFFQELMLALDFCQKLGIANRCAPGASAHSLHCRRPLVRQRRCCVGVRACRDIKLENTLLDAAQPLPNVKLCDFGYSKNEFVDSRPKTVSGTPDYIAPEVLLNDQYDGMKADIWSCGVMLYVMLTGALQRVPRTFGLPRSLSPRR